MGKYERSLAGGVATIDRIAAGHVRATKAAARNAHMQATALPDAGLPLQGMDFEIGTCPSKRARHKTTSLLATTFAEQRRRELAETAAASEV